MFTVSKTPQFLFEMGQLYLVEVILVGEPFSKSPQFNVDFPQVTDDASKNNIFDLLLKISIKCFKLLPLNIIDTVIGSLQK